MALDELQGYAQWVGWDIVDGKKVPINPNSNYADFASVSDKFSWSDWQRAYACNKEFDLEGVGFVFTEDDPFVGVDLDDVRDPESGEIDDWAWEIIEVFDSYTEVSPSGCGVHIIAKGDLPRAHKDSSRGIEMYSQGRFFCTTGRRIHGVSAEPEIADDAIGWAMAQYFERNFSKVEDDELDLMISDLDDFQLAPDDWLLDALEAIDPDCHHDEWISVGMALHNHFDGDEKGLELWDRWSKDGDKYAGKHDLVSRWSCFSDDRKGAKKTLRSVWWLAEAYGWHWEPDGHRWDTLEMVERYKEEQDEYDEDEGLFVSYTDAYNDRSPYQDFLIEPAILGPGDLLLWFGPPKSFKTMSMMAMCSSMAAGRQWQGLEPTRPLKIAYINFEMREDRMRSRTHLTWHAKDELEEMGDNFVYTRRFQCRLSKKAVDTLTEAADHELDNDIDILVIDPAINFFHGESENDNVEISKFLEGVRYTANKMGGDTDTSVILVHHTGKMTSKDSPFRNIRGASAFRGAYDTAVALEGRDNDQVFLQTEARNGPGVGDWQMRFSPSLGRFVSPRDGSDVQPMDEMDVAEAKKVIRWLRSEAKDGRLHSKSAVARGMADEGRISNYKECLALIDSLLKRKVLAFTDAGDPHHRSNGHICCTHQTWEGQAVWPNRYVAPIGDEGVIDIDERWWGVNDPSEDGPWCGYASVNEFLLDSGDF